MIHYFNHFQRTINHSLCFCHSQILCSYQPQWLILMQSLPKGNLLNPSAGMLAAISRRPPIITWQMPVLPFVCLPMHPSPRCIATPCSLAPIPHFQKLDQKKSRLRMQFCLVIWMLHNASCELGLAQKNSTSKTQKIKRLKQQVSGLSHALQVEKKKSRVTIEKLLTDAEQIMCGVCGIEMKYARTPLQSINFQGRWSKRCSKSRRRSPLHSINYR